MNYIKQLKKIVRFVDNNDNLWNDLLKPSLSTTYVSATKLKNHLINDPVLDWIELHYDKSGHTGQINKEMTVLKNHFFKKGFEFENIVFDEIKKTIGPKKCVKIIDDYKGLTLAEMNRTIEYMKNGMPIIFQAPLFNEINKTNGICDILIRSDYINNIFDEEEIDDSTHIGCSFSDKWHYRVIDVKWSQLPLKCNGKHILNSERYPAYKGQIGIYNLALGLIQEYIPDTAYILGKGYKYQSMSETYTSNHAFSRLGHVNFRKEDKNIVECMSKALEWYRLVLSQGSNWDIYTDNRIELCPNMNNSNDAPYTQIKTEIAKKRGEMTQIWRVGYKNRNIAISNGIFRWDDEKCCTSVLGMNNDTINKIMTINRNPNGKFMPITLSKPYIIDMVAEDDKYTDIYIDFETISSSFYKKNVSIYDDTHTFIFMMGVGYHCDNKWVFKEFHVEFLNEREERRMMRQFTDYISEISQSKIPRLFHWSQAENIFIQNYNKRQRSNETNRMIDWKLKMEFVDLYNVFTSEPIVVKGSMCYKLKDITKALNNMDLISMTWDTDIVSGLGAMIDSSIYYNEKTESPEGIMSPTTQHRFNSIIKYNECDCKALSEIHKFVKKMIK